MKHITEADLAMFIGTEHYYRLMPNHLLTDGTKYLADHAECYWLFDVIASYFPILSAAEGFVLTQLTVKDTKATVRLEDGNGNVLVEQKIAWTDFPLAEIKLYSCFDGAVWVTMLPSEY
jgi:hypothetical protein